MKQTWEMRLLLQTELIKWPQDSPCYKDYSISQIQLSVIMTGSFGYKKLSWNSSCNLNIIKITYHIKSSDKSSWLVIMIACRGAWVDLHEFSRNFSSDCQPKKNRKSTVTHNLSLITHVLTQKTTTHTHSNHIHFSFMDFPCNHSS